MADLLVNALSPVTGNRMTQYLLQRSVIFQQKLMGIGSGGGAWGSGERGALRAMQRSAPGPYCVFDVGANRGQFLTLAVDELAGCDYHLHSFEPSPVAFADLEKHAGRRVTVNNVAVGATQGEATLYFDEPGSTLASLTKRDLDYRGITFGLEQQVPVETIDAYCQRNGIQQIDLLKLDVEGHEHDVLAGAKGMFDRGAVRQVTFEFGGANLDARTSLRDFWQFFGELNMPMYRITPSGYLAPIRRYREIDEQYRTTNYTALQSA